MARHAAVDLAQVINAKYNPHAPDRLLEEDQEQMRKALVAAGVRLRQDEASAGKLAHLRSLYEPYVEAMSRNLQITLPPWIHQEKRKDNWQGGPWDRAIQARGLGEKVHVADEHF